MPMLGAFGIMHGAYARSLRIPIVPVFGHGLVLAAPLALAVVVGCNPAPWLAIFSPAVMADPHGFAPTG